MTRPFVALSGLALLLTAVPPLLAQDTAPPAHIAVVDGRVLLEHDTLSEEVVPNLPLEAGDRLRSERGRAEVLFGDGSLVHLDEFATLDVLSDTLLRLMGGRIAVVATDARRDRWQIDTPAGSVRITGGGEYRVAVFEDGGRLDVELAVVRGSAELITDHGRVPVYAGARAVARDGDAPSPAMPFNSARWDAFDAWSHDRVTSRRTPATASYQYVPPPLRSYGGVFETHGTWGYQPTYGDVWFPRVATGWRPYYRGRWRFYTSFGWTWVGGDAWTWPTHHYGRWGFTPAGAWFWIPGRVWGPAWVHWAVAPGYVSWCPIGFDNRPVLPFWGHRARAAYRYDPWSAWTVIPRSHFGAGRVVAGVALDGRTFDSSRSQAFVVSAHQPRGVAVPRAWVRPGTAVRRGDLQAAPSGAAPRASTAVRNGALDGARSAPGRRAVPRSEPRAPAAVRRGAPGLGTPGVRLSPPTQSSADAAADTVERGRRRAVPRSDRGTQPDGFRVAPTPRSRSAPPAAAPVAGPRTPSSAAPPGRRAPAAEPGVVPRAGPRAGRPVWNPDSIPVHRGAPIMPQTSTVPVPRARETYGAGTSAPPNTPYTGRAVPRGAPEAPPAAPPPRYRDSYSGGSPGRVAPAREAPGRAAPPPARAAEPSRGGPPPNASPRQAPEGGRRGTATPRGSGQARPRR